MRESRYNVWVERPDARYVFNSVSGALLRVPEAQYAALRAYLAADPEAACPARLLAQLIAGQMLVPDGTVEIDRLAARYHDSRADRAHFALTIVTSLGCNFDCPYCFEAKHPSILDADVQEWVLQVLGDQLPRIESFHVTWFGGEPLVGKRPLLELSDAFIARCDAAGVEYAAAIVTNGYLLDETTCRELRSRRVRVAQVSLDGPPEVHDRMRPLTGGRGSFHTIVRNLRHAVDQLDVSVRVNVDRGNIGAAEELFRILAAEGLAGRLVVYPGQIVGVRDNLLAPSASYTGCFTNPEFARAELDFLGLAARYGFAEPRLPRATAAPCTAVRANELVVGSRGELYKCWDSVGDAREVVGHIRDYGNPNGRLAKWLRYDPFADDECRGCVALPVCMGGCAHHAFDPQLHDNRCGTFRHTHTEQVAAFVDHVEERGLTGLTTVAQLARVMETR